MRILRCSLLLLVLLACATGLRAQTTGGIVGRVTDEAGAGRPAVTVEAKGPALQGSRSVTTDKSGAYRLSLLPPGSYAVTFTLKGFSPETRSGITVYLGKDTSFDLLLRPTLHEEVKVTGEAPPVDTTTSTVGNNLDNRQIETLPTGRNYASIVQVVPGVQEDANSNNNAGQVYVSVYGSSGAENSYYIDGVDTTGVEYGFQGKELNYEFIQEVDVKTGGYEAEYGKSTGGIVNVITKSGGNELHGDVFTYYDANSLQARAEPVVSTGGTVAGFTRKDTGFDLGGFFLKDKLWYFVAYDRVANTTRSVLPEPQAGQRVDSDSTRDLAAAKLTYRIATNHSLVGTFFQDPRTDTGAINDANHTLNGDPLTYLGERKFGGKDYALRYDGVIGSSWIVTGQVSRHAEENSVGPASASGDVIQYRSVADDFFQSGGFGLIEEKTFTRDGYRASVARVLGNHEIKLGAEHENESAEVVKRMSGGQQVDVEQNPVNPSQPIYFHAYWTTPDATIANAPVSALHASPSHRDTTAYLQDRWAIRPNLTLSFGVRWDRQEIIDASGARQIDLKKDYAPRLGISWDPTDDHRSKVYASYGRFYEKLPMDLVIRSFSYERQPSIINYSPTSVTPDTAAEADFNFGNPDPSTWTVSKILGGFTEPSDPDIRGQYIREIIVGGEREVVPDLTVGARYIFRDYRRVIEDFLCIDDGTYCIGNPGQGIMREIYGLDYVTKFPAPKAERVFRGLQLDVSKRFSHNWQAMASYLYSKLDGNYDGEYAPFTNLGADPNISAAYDYFDFFTDGRDLTKITNHGFLSNDRRHQLKASGVYITPFKLAVGASAYYRTGTPLTRYGYSRDYSRYEFFLTPRGGEGRTPAIYEADVHLGYPLKIKRVTANILLDVFNVLNAQRPVLLDERYGFSQDDNFNPIPANSNYLKPALRTPPTSFRFGLRITY